MTELAQFYCVLKGAERQPSEQSGATALACLCSTFPFAQNELTAWFRDPQTGEPAGGGALPANLHSVREIARIITSAQKVPGAAPVTWFDRMKQL